MRGRRGPQLKSRAEIAYQREAGLIVAAVHGALRAACQPGVTLLELDELARETTLDMGGRPNFLHYHGFPNSVCISKNDVIVHGIPSEQRVEEGDIVSFDCGAAVTREGKEWHADAAFSVITGKPNRKLAELDAATEQAMWAGIAALATAKRVGEVGAAIEDSVKETGKQLGWEPGIIEGYTGHGIGNRLHEAPTVYNYRVRGRTEKVSPGMVLCIEPMLVGGKIETVVADDNWAVLTADGSSASHWEHTVAVLDDGISVLTAPDFGAQGLAPYGIVPVTVS